LNHAAGAPGSPGGTSSVPSDRSPKLINLACLRHEGNSMDTGTDAGMTSLAVVAFGDAGATDAGIAASEGGAATGLTAFTASVSLPLDAQPVSSSRATAADAMRNLRRSLVELIIRSDQVPDLRLADDPPTHYHGANSSAGEQAAQRQQPHAVVTLLLDSGRRSTNRLLCNLRGSLCLDLRLRLSRSLGYRCPLASFFAADAVVVAVETGSVIRRSGRNVVLARCCCLGAVCECGPDCSVGRGCREC